VGSRLGLDRAAAARARGVDVLALSGTPQTPPPAHVLEAAARAARESGTAHSQGLPALREAIAAKLARDNGIVADPETEVLVTGGAQQGLCLALMAVLDPGDEVVVPTPAYFLDGLLALAAVHAVWVPTSPATGYALDVDRIARVVTPRTRAIVLVNPSNPGGHVATPAELQALGALAARRDLTLVCDESYERIVYDGRRHVSVAALPGVRDRVVTVHSCSKTYALAGWRVGYAAGPADAVAAMRKLLEWVQLGCDAVSQHAALAALAGPQEWTFAIREAFEANRDRLVKEAGPLPGMPYVVPEGNPNLFLDVRRAGRSAAEVAAHLLDRHGIRTTPGEFFQTPGFVRLEFGGALETVAEAGRRLVRAAEGLAPAAPAPR
jgi:aspartate/methionine/tyrosine aminotransferase